MSLSFSNTPYNPNLSIPAMLCTNNKTCKFATPQQNNNDAEDESHNVLEQDANVVTQ